MGRDSVVIIGVDPGKDGGIAVIDGDGVLVWAAPLNSHAPKLVASHLRYCANQYPGLRYVFVEYVHAMPGQGVTSMFNMGRGLGVIHGVIEANMLQVVDVQPQLWQKHAGVKAETRIERKRALCRKACELFDDKFRKSSRATTPHSGMCDAALIAKFAREVLIPKMQAK